MSKKDEFRIKFKTYMKLFLLLLLPFCLQAQTTDEIKTGSAKARSFLQSLSDNQRSKIVFPFDEMNRYEWHYLPGSMFSRRGISVIDLEQSQKNLLFQFMQSFLSKEGFTRTKDIMDLEHILKLLEPENPHRIPENYFIAVYGEPEAADTWGWKFSGHHIALNFTVVKDRMAFAPFFFGANPGEVKEGEKKGLRLLKAEEDLGFALVNSLSPQQKQKAIYQLNAFTDIVTTNAQQVAPIQPVGIFARDFTLAQKAVLNQLIVTYLLSMPKALADKRLKRISAEDMDAISFGWAGATHAGKPHYYRIQGKSFLIEFDNTQNNANHIHTVWRDFNGDFGLDLLKEHYHEYNNHH